MHNFTATLSPVKYGGIISLNIPSGPRKAEKTYQLKFCAHMLNRF